jgi:rubrerythrin
MLCRELILHDDFFEQQRAPAVKGMGRPIHFPPLSKREGEPAMGRIKGTETEKNLLKSFAGESQARTRYSYFASAAKKEGLVQIADIFEETANQEKEHAKRFFTFLEGGDLEVTACFPAGVIGTTAENLKAAAMGEHEEHSELYPAFARVAQDEGLPEIAAAWRTISVAEKQHEKRYLDLLANIENDRVFRRDETVTWRCRNCGYLHSGQTAAELCPACIHPQAHFELLGENW